MQEIVYARNPKGAAALRADLKAKAGLYGYDPAEVDRMKQPSLRRVIDDSVFPTLEAKQNAITDFNKTATAALTPSERALSDSRRVSSNTLDDVAARLDAKGPAATMSQVLDGKPGADVLEKLINDGVVSRQEQAGLLDDGELTKAGKDRVSQLMLGRFFKSPQQLDGVADSVRGKVERIAAPLAQVETKPGWNLTPDVQSALDLLDQARKAGIKNVDDFVKQDGLFGKDKWSPKAMTIAKAMQVSKSTEVTAAARQYAQDAAYADKGQSLMGDAPTPQQSFQDSFGALKSGAESDAAKALAKGNKPNVGEQAREYPAPGLTGNRFQEYPLDESDQYHADNARFERLKLDPEDDANAIAHVTNLSGMETLGRIIGEDPDTSAFTSKGRHIAPQEMHFLKSDLKDYGASSPAVDQLRAAADDAEKSGRSLIVVKDHELIPAEERASVLHEELDHALQQSETGQSLTEHLGASAKPLIESRLGKQAMSELEDGQKYKFRSAGEAAAEIGVRLMRPGRYAELGLSHDQAGVLGQQYVQALKKEYGNAAANRIGQQIFEALKSSR